MLPGEREPPRTLSSLRSGMPPSEPWQGELCSEPPSERPPAELSSKLLSEPPPAELSSGLLGEPPSGELASEPLSNLPALPPDEPGSGVPREPLAVAPPPC